MKFDEIVKALRLCGETTECISERIGCPYCENTDDCKKELLFDAADIIEAQQQEIDRLQQWVNDLQSGMYVNCVYCGHRYGMENDTPVAMADVLKEHIEHCSKHPMSKLKQEIEQLRDENISIRNWNACEEEQYGQLLESDKRRIKLEEQIEAQQREIERLRVARRWTPVTERLPENSDVYLCAFIENEKTYVERFYYSEFNGWMMPVVWQDEGRIDEITHWMPLPEGPKGGKDDV